MMLDELDIYMQKNEFGFLPNNTHKTLQGSKTYMGELKWKESTWVSCGDLN